MLFISSANNQQSRSNCLDFEELLVSVFIAREQVDPEVRSCSRHFSFFCSCQATMVLVQPLLGEHAGLSICG